MPMYRRIVIYIEAVGFAGVGEVDNPGQPLFIHERPDWLIEALAKPKKTVGAIWIEESPRLRIKGTERKHVMGYTLWVGTLEGPLGVAPGSYIARGVEGEIYPIAASVFQKIYAEVNQEEYDAQPECN